MAEVKTSDLTEADAGEINVSADWFEVTINASTTPASRKMHPAQLGLALGIGVGSVAWINPKASSYGALGNNSANDSTALQSALNAAGTALTVCYIPPGTYLANGLTIPTNVILWLDKGATIKKRANGNLLATNGAGVQIIGSGKLDGVGGSFTGHVVSVGDTHPNFAMDGITIVNTPNASSSVFVSKSDNPRITHCNVDGNVTVFNTKNVHIDDNPFVGGTVAVNCNSNSFPVEGVWVRGNNVQCANSTSNEIIVVHMLSPATTKIKGVHVTDNEAFTSVALSEGISIPDCIDVDYARNNVGVTGSGSISNCAVEIADCLRVRLVGGTLDGGGAVPNGVTIHNSQEVTADGVAVTGLTAASGSKAFFVYCDGANPVKAVVIAKCPIDLPMGVAADGVRIESNDSSAVIQDILVSDCPINGDTTTSTSTALSAHVDSGSIADVTFEGNLIRDCDIAIDYGAVDNITFRNNVARGSGRNLVTQSGSAPTGQRISEGNSWNRVSAAPTTGDWFVGTVVWNSAPSAGGAPGWVCTATTPTFKAMANLAA